MQIFETKNVNLTLITSSINDVTAIGVGSQGLYDDSYISLVVKSVTVGGEEVQNCMTSFKCDPLK